MFQDFKTSSWQTVQWAMHAIVVIEFELSSKKINYGFSSQAAMCFTDGRYDSNFLVIEFL